MMRFGSNSRLIKRSNLSLKDLSTYDLADEFLWLVRRTHALNRDMSIPMPRIVKLLRKKLNRWLLSRQPSPSEYWRELARRYHPLIVRTHRAAGASALTPNEEAQAIETA